jgi:hypothetical protein
MTIEVNGRTYRVKPSGLVQVYIKEGAPRGLALQGPMAHWRDVNRKGRTAAKVRAAWRKAQAKEQAQ